MNPLGSFSFGKIIKTFIPGLLAAAAVLLIVELLYRISSATPCTPGSGFSGCFFAGSFLRRVALVDTARTTALGALLIPLGLLLGFLLNTAMWFCVNDVCRARADRGMDENFLAASRAIEANARFAFRAVVGQTPDLPRVRLQDFYLPLMDLDKLTFLRESYFSWFEFHLNSVGALVLVGVAYAVTVGALAWHWSMSINWVSHLVVPLVVMAGVGWFLVVAGIRNLRRYQEGFVWLLIGTLHFRGGRS